MKKLIAVAALSILPFTNAMADPDIGCGLGSVLLAEKEGQLFKVLGATTNASSSNQVFGITFGTLGCDGTGPVTSSVKLALFIDGNMESLARDMSKGQGESLSTLAAVWGVSAEDKALFMEVAQANFSEVFTSEDVTSQVVLENLNALVTNNAKLAEYKLS